MSAAAGLARGQRGVVWRLPEPLLGAYIERAERVVYVCDVVSGDPGMGHCGRFLDGLKERVDVVVVPNVVSERLAGMLARRGFMTEVHWAPDPFNEHVPCWVWRRP